VPTSWRVIAKGATLSEVRLSILTASYNYAHWLPDALLSVAHQADPEVEHVVVDDGSTDDSPEVLNEWPGSLVVREKPNTGLSDTLNVAMDKASGEWLGWLNADDFYLPHALSTIRRAIKNYPEADMLWGDSVYVDAAGRLLRLVAQHPTNRRVLRLMGGHIAPCATFVRKAAVPKSVFDVGLTVLMDWDLSLAMLHQGSRMVWLPTPLGAFRRHGNQLGQPASLEEHNRVRRRYGLRTHPRLRRLAWHCGRVEHAVNKLLVGSYMRQLRIADLRGSDMRWFANEAALLAARRAVREGSGKRHRNGRGV
jgi:glycosyltransferase involved in cell wall biosynthesis